MTAYKAKTFRAKLEATGTSPRWVVARIPVDLKKAWPEWKTRRVRGEINGFAFATTLFPSPRGLTLVVNKKMQAGGEVRAGETAQIKLEPEIEIRPHAVPPELARELKSDKELESWFRKISPSMQKGLSNIVDQARGAETRRQRAERIAECILLAMEGELEPPPILRAAFQLQPWARKGWDAMTPTQRRNNLLGIFFAQTVEGRERRAAKAIEEAVRIAQRRKKG